MIKISYFYLVLFVLRRKWAMLGLSVKPQFQGVGHLGEGISRVAPRELLMVMTK